MYAPFVEAWLAAFPHGELLLVRTEDLLDRRRETLARVWRHVGLTPLPFDGASPLPAKFVRAEARLPTSYAAWTRRTGPISPATTSLLRDLFEPFNRRLRELLLAAQPAAAATCGGAGAPSCDAFLWAESVVD